jgi:hypothetical protein
MVRNTLIFRTNYAVGYKSRFFCLENGILSYYKSESEYPLSCRGSLSTLIADVDFSDNQDKSRFDVVDFKGTVCYSLKARSPADAKKWVWALKESKTWMIDHSRLLTTSERTSTSVSVPGSIFEFDGDEKKVKRSNEEEIHEEQIENDMPEVETEDLSTLQYLLDIQLDIQQRVIDSVLEQLKKGSGGLLAVIEEEEEFDVQGVPALLSSARMQVQKTVSKIVSVTEAREKKWYKKWKLERESKMRWEVRSS